MNHHLRIRTFLVMLAATFADYQLWRTISDDRISDDGRWVAWTYSKARSCWMTDGVPFVDKDRHLQEYAPRIFRRPIG